MKAFSLALLLIGFMPVEDSLEIKTQSFSYYRDNRIVTIVEFNLINNTQQDYYSWLDFNPASPKVSDDKARIVRYFFHGWGDFSFENLISDNVVFEGDFLPVIGHSFLVLIPPGNTFKYCFEFIDKTDNDYSNERKSIVCFPRPKVEAVLQHEIPQQFLFTGDLIVVSQNQ